MGIKNRWTGIGRLTKDPEVRTNGEKSVARLTLAIDRGFKKEDGTDYINCVAFGKTAEFAEKYMRKGRKFVIAGRIQTGSYTNRDGQKVYSTSVVIDEVEFADAKPDAAATQNKQNSVDAFMDVPSGADDVGLPFN